MALYHVIIGDHWSKWPPTYLSIYRPTDLPTYLPTFLPSYLPTYLSTHLLLLRGRVACGGDGCGRSGVVVVVLLSSFRFCPPLIKIVR